MRQSYITYGAIYLYSARNCISVKPCNRLTGSHSALYMVWVAGFEPATFWTQIRCPTKLSHTQIFVVERDRIELSQAQGFNLPLYQLNYGAINIYEICILHRWLFTMLSGYVWTVIAVSFCISLTFNHTLHWLCAYHHLTLTIVITESFTSGKGWTEYSYRLTTVLAVWQRIELWSVERQSTILSIERPDLIVNYNGRRGWTRTTDVSMSRIYSPLRSPLRYSPMAEGLGFEPRGLSSTSFQDWHLKPTRTTLDWCPWEDSNPQNSDPKSDAYANSATRTYNMIFPSFHRTNLTTTWEMRSLLLRRPRIWYSRGELNSALRGWKPRVLSVRLREHISSFSPV